MGCTASTVAVEPLSTDMAKELDPNETLLALIFTKQMIEKGELTEGKAIQDILGFLLRQMLAQHERDKRRQGNHEQANKLSPRHPIIQMLILLKAFRPGMMMDVREIIARLHFIILAIIEDRNEQGVTEFTPPVASPIPEQARIPIDQRTPQQKASDVEDVLNWVRNPTEDSIQTEPFKRIAELLPPKKLGGTPEDRANDIDNTLTWLRNRGVDDSNISVPDSRSPQQKDKDLADIAEWVRNPREHDSPERQPMIRRISCLDPLLPKKPGQPPEDRAKDLDLALRWVQNRGVDDSVRSNTEERTNTIQTTQMGCTASTVAVEPLSTNMVKELDPMGVLFALIVTKHSIENGELTEGKAIRDILGFLLAQLLAQRERDIRRQGNLEQTNKLSLRHPIRQMAILFQALRPGVIMMDVREIIARLDCIIAAIGEDWNEQGGTESTLPVASPCPEQTRIPIDRRSPEVKAKNVEKILDWILKPREQTWSSATEAFNSIDQLLPKKPGQTSEERANDIDNTLAWLLYRGVDEPSITIPDTRTPQQKAKDLEDVTRWLRNPARLHDSPENLRFKRVDRYLPKKPGQTQEDRAKDLELALRWIHNRGVDDSVRNNTEERTRDGGLAAMKLIFEGQEAGTVPMRLDFDESELERLADPEYIASAQFTPEQVNEVLQALKTHHPTLDFPSGVEFFQIAAQFKSSNMKTSALTPKEIEAILTRIVENQETDTLPDNVPIKVSFSDDDLVFELGTRASGLVVKPFIRVFSFKRVAAPPSTGTETDSAEESTAKVKKIKKKSAGTKKEVEGSKSKKKKVKKRSPGTGNGDEESKAKKKKVKAAEQDVDTEAQKSKSPSGSSTKGSGSSEDGGVDSTNTSKKKKKKKKVAVNSEPKKKRSEPKAER